MRRTTAQIASAAASPFSVTGGRVFRVGNAGGFRRALAEPSTTLDVGPKLARGHLGERFTQFLHRESVVPQSYSRRRSSPPPGIPPWSSTQRKQSAPKADAAAVSILGRIEAHAPVNPFLKRLDQAKRILIAGCGGGFDVFAGVPLARHLWSAGKEAVFANYSFTDLSRCGGERLTPTNWRVDLQSQDLPHFPERWLGEWLLARGRPSPIYAFAKSGTRQLIHAYRLIAERHVPRNWPTPSASRVRA